MSAMTDKDTVDILFALSKDVDYIALSFVQTSKDVLDAKEIIGNKANIIVKIEKPSAVRDIDSILDLADGVMVARGDLGVELPLQSVIYLILIHLKMRFPNPFVLCLKHLIAKLYLVIPIQDQPCKEYQGKGHPVE